MLGDAFAISLPGARNQHCTPNAAICAPVAAYGGNSREISLHPGKEPQLKTNCFRSRKDRRFQWLAKGCELMEALARVIK